MQNKLCANSADTDSHNPLKFDLPLYVDLLEDDPLFAKIVDSLAGYQ